MDVTVVVVVVVVNDVSVGLLQSGQTEREGGESPSPVTYFPSRQ